MLTRRAFGRALSAAFAFLVVPIPGKAKEYYTTFTKSVPAEDIGYSPVWFPDGHVQPVEKRPGDVVVLRGEGITKDGRSLWVRRDGNKIYLGDSCETGGWRRLPNRTWVYFGTSHGGGKFELGLHRGMRTLLVRA